MILKWLLAKVGKKDDAFGHISKRWSKKVEVFRPCLQLIS
jgi:hypothetical protein